MIRQFVSGNYEGFALCILTLLLLILPSTIEVGLNVVVPQRFEIAMLVSIYAAEVLGEINKFYVIIPYWDTILHTFNGFLAAGVGYSLVTLLNKNEKLTFALSPAFTALVAFCFSMAKVYQGTAQLIGNTPLVEFANIEKEEGIEAHDPGNDEHLQNLSAGPD